MTLFNFNTDTWQLAFHHGHSAFRLLKIAMDIENDYKSNISEMKNVEWGRKEYLHLSAKQHFMTQDMFRVSSTSVMMFQGMLEAIINNAIEKEAIFNSLRARLKGRASFEEKWIKALSEVNQDDSSFRKYHSSIYKKFRIPMTHPESITSTTFDDLCFALLHEGYAEGWDALARLHVGFGHPYDPKAWDTMCNTYGIPPTI